jgi:hypothetical protein
MALPLIPILIAGGLLLVMGKKPAKKNGDIGGDAPTPNIIPLTLDELLASSEIGLTAGIDILKVTLPVSRPASWTLYTEAIGGQPIIVVSESHIPGDADPEVVGDYGDHVFQIDAQQAGQIKADFVNATPTEVGGEIFHEHSVILNLT